MRRNHVQPMLAGVLMLGLSAAMMGLPLAAQEAGKKEAAKGRLPPYFGDVVDDKEKQGIYDIQAAYEPKIEKLEAELEAVKAERDAKIEKYVGPAKMKKIEEAKAAAAAKREEKNKKPDEKKLDLKPTVKGELKK